MRSDTERKRRYLEKLKADPVRWATHLEREREYERRRPKRRRTSRSQDHARWRARMRLRVATDPAQLIRVAAARAYYSNTNRATPLIPPESITGTCEICRRDCNLIPGGPIKDMICFDHDHTTNQFRGWLCATCNSALGMAKDSPTLLRKMADYLEGRTKIPKVMYEVHFSD